MTSTEHSFIPGHINGGHKFNKRSTKLITELKLHNKHIYLTQELQSFIAIKKRIYIPQLNNHLYLYGHNYGQLHDTHNHFLCFSRGSLMGYSIFHTFKFVGSWYSNLARL